MGRNRIFRTGEEAAQTRNMTVKARTNERKHRQFRNSNFKPGQEAAHAMQE
jgi:hypothetical protein